MILPLLITVPPQAKFLYFSPVQIRGRGQVVILIGVTRKLCFSEASFFWEITELALHQATSIFHLKVGNRVGKQLSNEKRTQHCSMLSP
jgi:hypothetical protein